MPPAKDLDSTKPNPRTPVDPATLLAEAQRAPAAFDIAAYFQPLELMRQKGYSWRALARWLEGYGLKVSAVHLRRLYVQQSVRRAAAHPIPRSTSLATDLVVEQAQADASVSPGPDPAPLQPELQERRRRLLRIAGYPEEEIATADLSRPVTVGPTTI